ncbi:MAG: hypothetical protein ACI9WU_004941 [Myxococcota bacterium]|jgi:hypothetical protein
MKRSAAGVAGLVALPLLVAGFVIMFSPETLMAKMGLTSNGPPGLNTVRGMVGGFMISSGSMLVLGILQKQPIWFLAVALLMSVATLGRGVGLALDGFSPDSLRPFVVELVLVGVSVWLYRGGART